MRIGVYVAPSLLLPVRAAFSRERDALIEVASTAVLRELAVRRRVDVVMVEPSLVFSEEIVPLLGSLSGPPAIPLVLYTAISPAAMRGTVEFARAGVRHVVLRGFDDGPRRFRALLEELANGSWESPLYSLVVRERIAHLPAPLISAVERLFHAPQEFRTVDGLARAAGLHRRNLERGLERSGLASARLLIASARVERAFAWLRQEGHSVASVARLLGAPSTRTFVREVKWVTGRAPGVLRHAVTSDELVRGLTTRLLAGGSSPAAPDRATEAPSWRHLLPAGPSPVRSLTYQSPAPNGSPECH